ncbi:MAG: ribosome biogenesis GTPase Der [Deltaproteobacteria bacterium]|nr:ribosome biogenesis GTPase Der [Deltaproteobacteria bacterium]
MKPIVAIIGRPNVGKSTLFNRLTRSRSALVDDFPGVTRDRLSGDAVWNDTAFTVVDTGGFAGPRDDPFAPRVREQVELAVAEADLVVVVFDGRSGVTPFDREMVERLHGHHGPVLYAVNKIDGVEQEAALYEFFALGMKNLYPISAEHRYGMDDFLDALVAQLPQASRGGEEAPAAEQIRIAVVGRPNVGKSSLINRILGQERLLVSDQPGTTRDAVDTRCTVGGRDYRLVDTAGIRRKAKVSARIEKFSVIKALRSLERCDVALVVVDAAQGITEQDVSIAGYVEERGRGCIFVVNKWDLVDARAGAARRMELALRDAAKFMAHAPVVTVSARTGQRVRRIFSLANTVYDQYTTRLGTGRVNRILEEAVTRTVPPLYKGRRLKFYYATQVSTRPPTFVAFVNAPEGVHFSYRRYLVNQIRQAAGLTRTPLRLGFRERSGRIDFGDGKKAARKPRRGGES